MTDNPPPRYIDIPRYVADFKFGTIREPEPDPVSRPAHYSAGMPDGVEVIDIIRAQGGGWDHSNAVKYVLRALFKGSTVQDYRKAIQYLTWAIEELEKDD